MCQPRHHRFRDIELEENENRKELTERERARTYKASKKLVEQAKEAEEVIGKVPKTHNRKGGRPTKGAVARKEVAEALGVDEKTVRNAQTHVELAERWPFMQGN
jgi:hypothetical protein